MGDDFGIYTDCGNCGSVRIMGKNAMLNVYSDGTNRLAFRCPTCQLINIRHIDSVNYNKLFPRVKRMYTDPPPEAMDPVRALGSAPPLTEADIAAFGEDLYLLPTERILNEAQGGRDDHRA